MRRSGRKRQDDQAGVDLSPLIDCVFLLLIFFLVTTMFKKFEHQIPIRMPDITSSLAEASREDVFQVGMSAAGRFHLQDAVGARGVLLTVVKDRPLEGHVPDAVCANYADLPAILAGME